MEDLTKIVNIGPVLAAKLNDIGIHNYQELTVIGSLEAMLRIQEDDPDVCYNMLYALEGAIRGIRWHTLPKKEREALKSELDEVKGW